MERIPIDGGGWFDLDSATEFEARYEFDGRNRVSVATGDQWVHESVLRTARGAWILCRWSQWQGSRPSYRRISAEAAAEWLARYGREGALERSGLAELAADAEV